MCASTLSVIGAALEAHVRQAHELGWAHPVQLPRPTPGGSKPRPALEACPALWPVMKYERVCCDFHPGR